VTDLEDAVSPLDQAALDSESLSDIGRQTGGTGLVVSNHAIFDGDLGHDFLRRRL
jgi:hypothetical protein